MAAGRRPRTHRADVLRRGGECSVVTYRAGSRRYESAVGHHPTETSARTPSAPTSRCTPTLLGSGAGLVVMRTEPAIVLEGALVEAEEAAREVGDLHQRPAADLHLRGVLPARATSPRRRRRPCTGGPRCADSGPSGGAVVAPTARASVSTVDRTVPRRRARGLVVHPVELRGVELQRFAGAVVIHGHLDGHPLARRQRAERGAGSLGEERLVAYAQPGLRQTEQRRAHYRDAAHLGDGRHRSAANATMISPRASCRLDRAVDGPGDMR